MSAATRAGEGDDVASAAGQCTLIVGRLQLRPDAFGVGSHPNPTRSLLLADPSGTVLYGCQLEVEGIGQLINGLDAPATFRFWTPYLPPLPGPWPVWCGRAIGLARELARPDSGCVNSDTLPAMTKKVETIVTLIDDLDGGKADRTIPFAFNGTSYEIDLSKKNATAFEKALAPFLGVARRTPKATRGRSSAVTAAGGRARSRDDLAAIREWAKSTGLDVSSRGRISHTVQAAYDAAH